MSFFKIFFFEGRPEIKKNSLKTGNRSLNDHLIELKFGKKMPIKMLSKWRHDIQHNDTQHNDIQCLRQVLLYELSFMLSVTIRSILAECRYARCRSAECFSAAKMTAKITCLSFLRDVIQ
jgi:hypothetical protein